MNHFLNLVYEAHQNRWCTRPFCSTCGSMEFRNALRHLGPELAHELAALDLNELEAAPNWRNTIRIALDELTTPDSKDLVFTAWLPKLEHHIRLADLVLFYYVRRGALFAPMSLEVLIQWQEKCVDLACKTRNASLVESLIYTLDSSCDSYPCLEKVIRDLSARDQRVAKARQRTAAVAR